MIYNVNTHLPLFHNTVLEKTISKCLRATPKIPPLRIVPSGKHFLGADANIALIIWGQKGVEHHGLCVQSTFIFNSLYVELFNTLRPSDAYVHQ